MAKAILSIVLVLCYFALLASPQVTSPSEVDALNVIRRKLKDPKKNLRNWKKGDPCTSNWTGVICTTKQDDGYFHVQELRMLNLNLSGNLTPELGQLSNLTILNFMWNNITGSIPKEIGNIKSLKYLFLSGNQLSGSLADELGYLPNLIMFQIDLNQISGSLPKSFVNLVRCKHFHMSNNSISGQIPPELSNVPQLQHFLLDNNNLSGYLSPELSQMPSLKILQLDNNNFGENQIPASYGNMANLVKLSLRNCNLQGAIPDFSSTPLRFLDLRHNQLTGGIPTNKLSDNITTIDLSYNLLNGSIPSNFSGLPNLQRLSVENNSLSGDVPSNVWQNVNFTAKATLLIDLRNNLLSNISGSIDPPSNVIIRLEGNPICVSANQLNIAHFCGITIGDDCSVPGSSNNSTDICLPQICPVRISKGVLIGKILGAIFVLALSLVIMVLFYKRRSSFGQEMLKKQSTSKVPFRTERVKEFSFVELEAATSGFKDTSQVGQGGYGKVYRGILANGTVVAIKRARQGSLQGQIEFITEIELLSRLHHRNLVILVGYCSEQGEQMLVYEFMPNGSLHDLLSDRFRHTLSFSMRLRIALGSAKGILYLHTEADPPIIYRDIKANNILLDFKFTPKVSDFGISRLAPVPDVEGASAHVSTVVKGTPGYLDPEYFLTHKLTEKSDVYSLGIVFLELLTGMRPISHGRNIVREVYGACQSGLMFSIIDQRMGSYSYESIKKFMALALKCCQDGPKERPTMLEIVRELENLCLLLPEPDMIPIEPDASTSEWSGVGSSLLNPGRKSKLRTTEILGSELVSGEIPTIRAR